ncbi:hypothetical protein VIN30_01050 [Adlercreutzia sp. R7]|uniref:Uncharacterized protein n=1 Tax=Adlercreutzia wanghongyangiae TaxID=3111451 RepID=A0ABU6IF18_9ACTN|nr:hypothetical protein [Adlercreutzia sp. R7]
MWFKRKGKKAAKLSGLGAQAPADAYYAPDHIRIDDLNFDRPSPRERAPRIQHIDVGGLVGASVFESAVCASTHAEALVFAELSESIQVIERKFHGGQYDAQAMPLVEAFLSELRTLAHIQMERNGIIDQHIADIRRANIVAYQAVCEARERREESIDRARMHDLRVTAIDYERREAKTKRRQAVKMKRDELKGQQVENREVHRDEKKKARQARMRHRHERRMRQEQARAEQAQKRWQMRQERSEINLEKMRGEKAAMQAERMTRQAVLEADAEIARANKHRAQMQEEQARKELERIAAVETLAEEEKPACDDAVPEVEAEGEISPTEEDYDERRDADLEESKEKNSAADAVDTADLAKDLEGEEEVEGCADANAESPSCSSKLSLKQRIKKWFDLMSSDGLGA